MNKKLDKQISDIKNEINELIRGISEDGRTGSDVCRELQYINGLLDELIKEINPADIKEKAEELYRKYIERAKEHNKNNVISPTDFFSGAKKIFERNILTAKLDILAEILGYDIKKVKSDIERDDY